jgi:hypothetical protein
MSKSFKNQKFCWVLQVAICFSATVVAQGAQLSRGTQWVRSYDFTIMAAVGESGTYSQNMFNSAVYRDMGNSTFLPWVHSSPYELLERNAQVALPWHQLVVPLDPCSPDGVTEKTKALTTTLLGKFSNNTGFAIADEPTRMQMGTIAAAQNWYRQKYPNSLVYTNLNPEGQPDGRYYDGRYDGTTLPSGGYNYSQYLDDYIRIVNPDILMYDLYPFGADGSTSKNFFSNRAIIREKALKANIPYWAWIQSWSSESFSPAPRTPSGSDIRMDVFSHLTYGFTGISYFTYNNLIGAAIINDDNTERPLYGEVKNINAMLKNLGKTLKYLKSTDVRYIPGAGNSLPTGTIQWATGAGGDTHITNISINSTGTENNALIGFFTDDAGQQYFMFTNLKHGASLTPGAASLQFTITFDSTINAIQRLNSLTGATEVLTLTNHAYTWDIAGGTGDLFKYNTGAFVPVQADAMKR